MPLLYHGTNSKRVFEIILKEGFKEGTYFTPYLNSAITYGGKWVFAIGEAKDRPGNPWEIIMQDPIPPERILFVHEYSPKLIYLNKEAMLRLRRDEVAADGNVMCENCKGRGEHRDDKYAFRYLRGAGGGAWRTRKDRIKVCEKCNGYGLTKENK